MVTYEIVMLLELLSVINIVNSNNEETTQFGHSDNLQ